MMYSPYPGASAPTYVAEVLGVPVRTARYWKKQGRMPEAFGRLWQLAQDPDLGAIDPQWRGYKLRNGAIETPEGRTVSTGDVQALPLLLDLQQYWRHREKQPVQYLMEV